ncbi:hypothetical protein [Roseovarius nanhaiticus]|uniref:hypothetical protein n=1 Tax=Roseovarius nanhaiticus TaxID=573024 RepID=UPI0024914A75|nr:hypothetical protein [Roseovarius nanhaiticus]
MSKSKQARLSRALNNIVECAKRNLIDFVDLASSLQPIESCDMNVLYVELSCAVLGIILNEAIYHLKRRKSDDDD